MLPDVIDRLHSRVVAVRLLVTCTAVTRVLLALAFLPSGLTKALGRRFTTLSVTDPVDISSTASFPLAGTISSSVLRNWQPTFC